MDRHRRVKNKLLVPAGVIGYLLLAFASFSEQAIPVENGQLEYIAAFHSKDELKTLYDHYQLPVLVIQDHIYLPNSSCAEKRMLGGDAEERTFASDTENRDLASDSEIREQAGDTENRTLSGEDEADHDLQGETENRDLRGKDEDRNLAGDDEGNRTIGKDSEDRNLGEDTETRNLSGSGEDRSITGDAEVRNLSSAAEERNLGGNTMEIFCVKVKDKAAFQLKGYNPNAKILVYDLNGLREVSGEIIEYY